MSRSPFITGCLLSLMTLGLGLPAVDAAPEFLTKWGSQGSGNGQFEEPTGIAVDSNGKVFVADKTLNRVQIFDSSGNYIDQFGGPGSGNGQFDEPRGIAIDSSDNILVVDRFNGRVQKFTNAGVHSTNLITGLSSPFGITIDGSGDIYITENSLAVDRVSKFSSAGSPITTWAGITDPRGVVADNAGGIYVTDTIADEFEKFTSTGTHLGTWGETGTGPGDFQFPIGMAFGTNLWIVDEDNHRIQELTTGCAYLSEIGSFGSGDGQFNTPTQIAIAPNGDIYVVDNGNYRVQQFGEANQTGIGDEIRLIGPPLAFPNPTSASSTVEFQLLAPETDLDAAYRVEAWIYSVAGRRVRNLYSGEMAAGDRFIRWDGKLDDGQPTPPGIFFMRIAVDGRDHRTAKIVRVP